MKHAAFISLITTFLCVASSAQSQKADCPVFSVIGPAGVTAPGDGMSFELSMSDSATRNISVEWEVSAGSIIEGQGTRKIKVTAPKELAGSNIRATAKVTGLARECQNIASELGPIAQVIEDEIYDQYGPLRLNDEKARLQADAFQLERNPNFKLVILKRFSIIRSQDVERVKLLSRFLMDVVGLGNNQFKIIVRKSPVTDTTVRFIPASEPFPN